MAQTTNRGEMKGSCMWYPHASEMLTLMHNGANSVEVKIAIILNIMHNVFYPGESEIDVRITLIILKRADGFNH